MPSFNHGQFSSGFIYLIYFAEGLRLQIRTVRSHPHVVAEDLGALNNLSWLFTKHSVFIKGFTNYTLAMFTLQKIS